jgi:hypothetical protein
MKTKQIDIRLIDSKENPVDVLTKALPKVDFERHLVPLLYESFLRIATALSLSVQIGISFVSSSKRVFYYAGAPVS